MSAAEQLELDLGDRPQDVVEINGRRFVIDRVDGLYGCGILPLRLSRDDLIHDIERSQGPEWRNQRNT